MPSAQEARELTSVSAEDVKRRVNHVLDGMPAEQERSTKRMKRKYLISGLAAAALCGTMMVAAAQGDYLRSFFTGDTSSVQAEVLATPATARIGEFDVTLMQAVSDDNSAYLTVSFTALTDAAKEQLDSDIFPWYVNIAGSGSIGASLSEVREARTADTAVYSIEVNGLDNSSREPIYLYLWDLNDEKVDGELVIPTDNELETVILTPNQKVMTYAGPGSERVSDLADTMKEITVEEVALSPLSIRITYTGESAGREGFLRFVMDDGTICGAHRLVQYFDSTLLHDGLAVSNGKLREVTMFSRIRAIVIGSTAYPLDGGAPYAVEDAVTPFLLTPVSRKEDGMHWFSVSALCAGLHADLAWNETEQTATIVWCGETYTLPLGESQHAVPGEAGGVTVSMEQIDGQLYANYYLMDLLRVGTDRVNIGATNGGSGDYLILP